MPALGELAGHEVVAGVEARQPGEVRERGVRGEHQDQHGARLEAVVEGVAGRAGSEDDLADLGDDGGRALGVGGDVHVRGEEREAEEHRPEGRAHDDEGGAGVAPLRGPKRGNAVRDRLDAGDRGTTRREGAEHDEQRRPGEPAAPGVPDGHETGLVQRLHGKVAEEHLADADPEQRHHAADEEVGGQREHPTRLPHAPQVPERDEHDEEHGDRHRVGGEAGRDRGQSRGAGRHGHGDREHVVGQQRHAGDLRG